jgi:hypothetical protein
MRARLSDDQGWRQNRHDHHKGCARTPTSDRVSPQLSTTHRDFAEPVTSSRSIPGALAGLILRGAILLALVSSRRPPPATAALPCLIGER